MPFKKGGPAGPGRPQGSKTRKFTDPSCWLEMIWDDIQDLAPEKRWPMCKWAVEQILAKVPALPATPGDSVSNAANAFNVMNTIALPAPSLESNPGAPQVNPTDFNGNGPNGDH